jgi:hypothetical protein
MTDQTQPAPSRIDYWAARLDRVPRLTRVFLSLAITAELTVLLSLMVDRLLIDSVVSGDVDALVPALVAVGVGVVLYVVGWWALVGFDLDLNEPWHGGPPAVMYVAAGAAGAVLLVALILFGLAFGYVL